MKKPRQPDRYAASLASCPPIAREEETRLARLAVAGDAKAVERFVLSNLRSEVESSTGPR